ncbi:MAG: hypothetical protein R3B07_08180 [Polyangiaceae bacterium]
MSPSLANFLFESANLLLLAAGLGWLLFKPVKRALDAESARHTAACQETQRALEQAKATEAEANELAKRLRAEAERREHDLLDMSRIEADKLLSAARAAIAQERRAFNAELKATQAASAVESAELVGRIAGEAVRNLMSTLDGPALDRALVSRAIVELEQLGEPARRAVSIEAARPLSRESKQALGAVLGAVEERVVPELGAGVRVTTCAGRVDATASGCARQAAVALQNALTPKSPGEAGV